jgi:3-oxoacyl-[acyl-carrier protein] reductase
MNSLSSIDGQVAVVSGGTKGIGLACAERFAAEGARVAVISRNEENGREALQKIQGHNTEAIFIRADCTSGEDVRSAIASVAEHWGRIDLLVNCHGGFRAVPPIEEIDEAAWRAVLDWNLTSKFLVLKEVVPHMKRNRYGRIVNVASVAGRTGIARASLEYSTAKAGVEGLTRRVAVELAPFGITANVVAPGTTLTLRVAQASEQRLERVRQGIPVGRLGQPEEIAHGIWYLCTPGAGFVTGTVLDMNGGVWTG